MVSVLFVFSIRNYNGFNGLCLNNPLYGTFPSDHEVLLADGTNFYVLKVEKSTNTKDGQENTLYIIHLCNWVDEEEEEDDKSRSNKEAEDL